VTGQGVRGHALVRHGPGDWRCKCGVTLSGGPFGYGRQGARDVMRFHRIDLQMAEMTRDAARLTAMAAGQVTT
jgi:hypothetical protein